MNSLFTYIVLGISIAAPIGPVNAAQLDTGLKNGFFHSLTLGLGAIIADILYMGMVYFGIGHFLDSPFMKIFLWSFGCFVLIYTGIEGLLSIRDIKVSVKSGKSTRLRQSLLSGFLVSLLNPLTILFWLGIYGSILAETSPDIEVNQIIILSLAIIAGILLWAIVMALLSSVARKFLSDRLLTIISFISSFSMIVFGIYFGLLAYRTLF